MKRITILVATVLLWFGTFAQNGYAKSHQVYSFMCSYYGEPVSAAPVMGFRSSTEAKEVINSIIDVIGLKSNFEIRSANIPNAAAIVSSGKRYVLYNPQFVAAIDKAAGDKWASIAILAHEIGHHLNGHTLMTSGSQPDLELEADEFSGFILRQMGASLQQAQLAMKVAADVRATRTHPGKDDRLTAIAEGWYKANNRATGRNDVAKRPAPQKTVEPVASATTVVSDRNIAYDVRFNADRNTAYYVTTSGNLVTFKGNQLLVIGKLQKTGNSNYPFKISDDKTALLVASNGSIITSSGTQVGFMKNHV